MKRDKQTKQGHTFGKPRSHGTYRKDRKPNSKYVYTKGLFK